MGRSTHIQLSWSRLEGHRLLVIPDLPLTNGSREVVAEDWSSRIAGVVVLVVGALNLLIGVLALTTGLVRVSAGVAGGFLAAGVVLLAVGALIWRGNRAATIGTFAVVLGLLVLQVVQIVTDPDRGDAAAQAASADQPAGRLVVLGLLVLTTGLAAWHRRHRPSRDVDPTT
jgi:hypothetical protein